MQDGLRGLRGLRVRLMGGPKRFVNREQAGVLLARRLASYKGRADVTVCGLPRGGVPVAAVVARALGVPLEVLIVRKLGVPGYPEYAMGAVASGGLCVLQQQTVRELQIDQDSIDQAVRRALAEIARREVLYGVAVPGFVNAAESAHGAATGASIGALVGASMDASMGASIGGSIGGLIRGSIGAGGGSAIGSASGVAALSASASASVDNARQRAVHADQQGVRADHRAAEAGHADNAADVADAADVARVVHVAHVVHADPAGADPVHTASTHSPNARHLLQGRVVIVVDDGLATGATMWAAVEALRQAQPSRIVVAVPVGAPDTCAALGERVDALICLRQPSPFNSVGQWYRDFSQVSDDAVRDLLAAARGQGGRARYCEAGAASAQAQARQGSA